MRTGVEVGCTYTGETELLLCSMNMDYAIENHFGDRLGFICGQDHSFHSRRDAFLRIFLGICIRVSPVVLLVYLKILRKHSTTIFPCLFLSAWASCIAAVLSFFLYIYTAPVE